MKTIIGIDPGLNGGLASLSIYNTWIFPPDVGVISITMPTTGTGKDREIDLPALVDWLDPKDEDERANTLVAIERVHSMPKQGVASTFKFGKGFGQILGVCAALKLSLVQVTPQHWKKLVLAGRDWKGNKAASLQYVNELYPALKLKKTEDGKADAICIALATIITPS